MPSVILLIHNIRSTFNVGSLFRTAEGCGVERIIISGYSPYPTHAHDIRLPHIREKITRDIHKTALGAENLVPFDVYETPPFDILRQKGYRIVGLEQTDNSLSLPTYCAPARIALLIGEEVDGITSTMLSHCDEIIEIPMRGRKESFNVSVATGIALYALTYNQRDELTSTSVRSTE